MKKIILLSVFILGITGSLHASYESDTRAYVIYNQANEFYRANKLTEAQNKYIELINTYPDSKYVPYSLYMMTFLETDYLKLIDYLNIIKERYHDFRYWQSAMEKLGDIYYVVGNYSAAIEAYKLAATDKAYYMMAMLYSADGFQQEAISSVQKLLNQTTDYALAYRAYLIQAKALIAMVQYSTALNVLQEAMKLKKWSYDGGARVLYYAGKSLFYKREFAQALYAFSLLRTQYPFTAESTLAKNYLTYLERNNIIVSEPVAWISEQFGERASLPFVADSTGFRFEVENQAEETVDQAENLAGRVVTTDVLEYVVRIGSFQDLGVANLVAKDISSAGYTFPIGIYFREGLYFAEIRGLRDLDTAKSCARQMMDLGYTDTKVIEVVKLTEYGQ